MRAVPVTLSDRIAAFLRGAPDDAEALALALFEHQRTENPVYAAIARGADPQKITEIPVVPVPLFRDLDVTAAPPAATDTIFRTSGTTGASRGTHRLPATDLYDLSASTWFRAVVPDAPRDVVSLVAHTPDSSLGHMVASFADSLDVRFSDGALLPGTWHTLHGTRFVAATAFALDALLAEPGTASLEPGSLVMVTGGFKGRRVRLDAPALYRAIPRLGTPRVVGEYGMTELSSQLWTRPVPAGSLPSAFLAPPWLHVYTVDPVSGRPAPEGVLRFVDLANVYSVLAIETMDIGRVEGNEVTLLGRLDGAELRGCSLRAEDLVERVRHEKVLSRVADDGSDPA